MKKVLIAIFSCFAISGMFGQGIQFFEGTWEAALEKSKAEEKLIFVDAYTTWCGPCKRMAKNVFTKDEVGNVYNDKFINVKMNMEDDKNISFISKYPVSAYPTLLFINGEGKIILKKVGGQQVQGLLDLAKSADKKDDKSLKYVEEYESGRRDFDFVLAYVKALNKSGKSSVKVCNEFLKSKPELSQTQWDEFLFSGLSEVDSKLFDKMLERKDAIVQKFGNTEVLDLVEKAANKTINKSIEFEIIDLTHDAIEKYGAFANKEEKKTYASKSMMRYYSETGDVDKYLSEATVYFKKIAKKDNEKLNKLVEGLQKYGNNEVANDLQIKAAKQLVKNDKSWTNMIAYGKVLFVQKKYAEAKKTIEAASKLASTEEEKRRTAGILEQVESKV